MSLSITGGDLLMVPEEPIFPEEPQVHCATFYSGAVRPVFSSMMATIVVADIVITVDVSVLPGDLGSGDLIVLPGELAEVLVKAVRLGHGGFILTVSPDGDEPAADRLVTLTASTELRKHGRTPAVTPSPSGRPAP